MLMKMAKGVLKTATSDPQPGCGRMLFAARLKEYVSFDSFVCRKAIALLGLVAGSILSLCGRTAKAFAVFSIVHRAAYSDWISKIVERWVQAGLTRGGRHTKSLVSVCEGYVQGLESTPATARFHEDPPRLLGTRVLVLKSPRVNEKGVVLIDYTFALSLFMKKFDVAQVSKRYHIVLEPSWSGYCDPDILCYYSVGSPVFVQAPEPRDAAFLRAISGSFVTVPIGDNWWVDHRIFRPLPGRDKDVDVVMIGSWGPYKRHYKLFAALARLRSRGERLRAVLVGYPGGYTKDDILHQARYYDVEDQIEIYEGLCPPEVNEQYNRAKVNLIWSRREGCNRASIEGMFAGTPCILRKGFNYGHHYKHINSQTGLFASEKELPDRLVWVARNGHLFRPRDWVLDNMSCQKATEVVEAAIRSVAIAAGEKWTRGLAVKVTYVGTMKYWDETDARKFEDDYAFLMSVIR